MACGCGRGPGSRAAGNAGNGKPKAVSGSSAAPELDPWQDPAAHPFLEIRGVTKTFGQTYAVDDLSLAIYPGEFCSLLGAFVCGNTPLLRLLAGLERPDQGQILIDGQDVSKVTQDSLRAAIGMVTQDSSLLHRSVRANILYGRPDATEEQMFQAARRAERGVRLLEVLGAAPDHPQRPDFGRSRYLKGLLLAVD